MTSGLWATLDHRYWAVAVGGSVMTMLVLGVSPVGERAGAPG